MNGKAILKGREVVQVDDLFEWARWLESHKNRRVAQDIVGDVRISTVFLGLDHGFGGPPLWFETMIFGGVHDQYQDRYETWAQAEAGHAQALALVKTGLN